MRSNDSAHYVSVTHNGRVVLWDDNFPYPHPRRAEDRSQVLIIGLWEPQVLRHHGKLLEIAQRHISAGDHVTIAACYGFLKVCDKNVYAHRWSCDKCNRNRNAALSRLTAAPELVRLDDYCTDQDENDARDWVRQADSIEDLKELGGPGGDLGWGAVSSVVSQLRDPVCDSDAARAALRQFALSAFRAYRATKAFLESRQQFSVVYVFNGRQASNRGAWRACQDHGVKVRLFEAGWSHNHFDVFENHLPHSVRNVQSLIEEAWADNRSCHVKESAGHRFFRDRRRGIIPNWKGFLWRQREGALPDGWRSDRRNVVIFNSSEDEFVAIGDEWKNSLYSSQREGIARIVEDGAKLLPNVHFTLRIHPNLCGVKNADLDKLLALSASNLTVIRPDSSVSSYALLDRADIVLTFGSTLGVEATYWRKPSIVAGPSFYSGLDVAHFPSSHDQLMQMLRTGVSLKPLPNALKYGCYFRTRGIPFRYYRADGIDDGVFRGLRLSDIGLGMRDRLKARLRRMRRRANTGLREAVALCGLRPVAEMLKRAAVRAR